VRLILKENKNMPKPQFSAKVHSLSHDGRGIATIGGKTTFIRGALPDEDVLFCYKSRHGSYDEGEVTKVLTASTQRLQPKCAHFSICGGCSLQHISAQQQLDLKQQTLLTQLRHFGQVNPENVLPPLTGATWGYRQKARLGVKFVTKKNKLLIGFHETNGRYTADLNSCPILSNGMSEHLPGISQLIHSLSCYEHIPQIEIAAGDNKIALIFRHLIDLSDSDKQKLIEFGKQHNFSIYLQPNKSKPTEKLWPVDNNPYLSYHLPAFQLEMLFQPDDFTQINASINEPMIQQAIALLAPKPQETVLDLFCGIGNFSLALAQYCHQVVGIEGSTDMTIRAQKNALHNHITNVEFYPHDLTQPFTGCSWAKRGFDKILLDPPRSGALEVVKNISYLKANSIVYISCNPATLARDAGELIKQGYRLINTGIMDMFPHTQHVECIAHFVK
jgi:23S rRNA (uracil1939-C5)-methyltransferase